ncbi:MAG: hypothetical protein U0793_10575 [Gemmataceae bacterium]
MLRTLTLTVLVVLGSGPIAFAQDRYYAVFFAANNGRPSGAHTFATFVRLKADVVAAAADGAGGAASGPAESLTISWLPASGVVVPRLLGGGEPGRNFGLKETLDWCKRLGAPVTAWGPVEIKKELFDLAAKKKRILDSGAVSYRMLDRRGRGGDWTNCIHAVSDIVPGPLLATGTAYGEAATQMVANHLRPYLIDPDVNHESVLRYLGIDGFEMRHQALTR